MATGRVVTLFSPRRGFRALAPESRDSEMAVGESGGMNTLTDGVGGTSGDCMTDLKGGAAKTLARFHKTARYRKVYGLDVPSHLETKVAPAKANIH